MKSTRRSRSDKSEYDYTLQRLLSVEDRDEPQLYERRRIEAGRLSEEDLKLWNRTDFETLVERRSDVHNVLATRIVLMHGRDRPTVYELEV
jgi:hypothetical protein